MTLLVLLAACAPSVVATEARVEVTLDHPVVDPRLDGFEGVTPTVRPRGDAEGCAVEAVRVENAHGQAAALTPGDAWDGLDDAGAPFLPGPFAVVADVACADGARASGAAEGAVVRAGVATVDFVDPDGSQAPLAFHRLDLVTREVTPVDMPEYAVVTGVSALDDEAGAPRAPVPVWTDPASPPWGRGPVDAVDRNLPAAYRAGASPRVRVTLGALAVGVDGHLHDADGGLPMRAAADGWTRLTDDTLDGPPLADTLGVADETVTWRFEAELDGTWHRLPGRQVTHHRLYRTLGPAQLRDGAELGFAANRAWVGVLAELAPVLEGRPATPEAVLDAVRGHLYDNPWVIYDPSDGDYSGYDGSYIYWNYAWSELSDWLDRGSGVRLYCHSMSCLLSVLANHEGAWATQEVLGVYFTTHLTRAAGTEDWLRWTFNSHSVVSPDGGLTLWDASVDLDADEDPANQPVTPLAPLGLPAEDYLAALSGDPIGIVNSGQCYFR